jgi:hypothetical protein
MVPGGELLDGASLLREAVDYVVHLRAQVAVLRRVANAVQHMAGTLIFPRFRLMFVFCNLHARTQSDWP